MCVGAHFLNLGAEEVGSVLHARAVGLDAGHNEEHHPMRIKGTDRVVFRAVTLVTFGSGQYVWINDGPTVIGTRITRRLATTVAATSQNTFILPRPQSLFYE